MKRWCSSAEDQLSLGLFQPFDMELERLVDLFLGRLNPARIPEQQGDAVVDLMLYQACSALRWLQSIAVVRCQHAGYAGVLMEFLQGDYLLNSGCHGRLRAIRLGHLVFDLCAFEDLAVDRD